MLNLTALQGNTLVLKRYHPTDYLSSMQTMSGSASEQSDTRSRYRTCQWESGIMCHEDVILQFETVSVSHTAHISEPSASPVN